MENNSEDWVVECSDDEKYEVDPKVISENINFCSFQNVFKV